MNLRRGVVLGLAALAIALAGGTAALALWSHSATASGYSKALSIGAGNTPTANAAGAAITVSWATSTFSNGADVNDYVVKRYDAVTDALQTIGTGCSGTVTALTCTETSVPVGYWKYTVTPRQGAWTGAESSKSTAVTVVGQVSPSSLATGHPTAASPMVTSSVTPPSSVVFVWVKYFNTPSVPSVSSISGLGCTWAEITNVVSGKHRLSLWYGKSCSGSGTISVTPSAVPSTNAYAVDGFLNIDPVTPFVAGSVKSGTGGAGATSASVSPNTLQGANNSFYVGLNHPAADNVTPLNGSTEISDDNGSSSAGIETNALVGWTSGSMGGSWTSATNDSTVIGVELSHAAGPTVTSATPSSRAQGTSNQNVTITGTGFAPGALASFSGTGITVNSTTFVSSTQLTANITVASNAATGARNITVTNTDLQSGSCSGCFTVNTPPTVTSTSPSSRGRGATSQNVTITGTGFASGASSAFSASGITVNTTTFVSGTQLTANVTISAGATLGAGNVTVTNTDGGSAVCTGCFTVNAAPTVSSASPSSRGQGASSQDVTVNGTGFVSGASLAAAFSGSGITVNSTTFVSATQVTANITITAGATTGLRNITVTNGDAGTGSCSNCFTVDAKPTVTSTSPTSRGRNASNQNITVNGTGFVSGATASFAASGVTVNSTTFVSATQLTANITVSPTATTGAGNVLVTNPDAGVGTCSNCFTVNAAPTVTSTSPSSRGQGASSQNVTVNGTGFVTGTGLAATFSGTGITVNSTTFVSSTQVTANITIAAGATVSARDVTVTNPDAGNATCSGCFTVNAAPTVTSTSPSSRGRGATSQSVTVNGTGFTSGAAATFSGTGITVNSTTFVSATQVTANITVASNATLSSRDVTITNPDAGSATCSGCFTVNAAPTVTSTSPSSRGQGAVSQNVTVNGTGFVSGGSLAAAFSGSGITVNSTTFVSATQVTANITIAAGATTGSRNITLTNGDAGVGSCSGCFTVNAAPTITSPTSALPQTVTNGQTVSFNIIGTGFVNGATVTISGGFTVNSVTFTTSTILSVNVKANTGQAQRGTYDLTVTNPDGGTVTSAQSMVNQ
jgi:hypothetical protein